MSLLKSTWEQHGFDEGKKPHMSNDTVVSLAPPAPVSDWPSFSGRCTMTPEFGIALSDASREYIHAWRLEGPRAKDTTFELRIDAANDEAIEHRVGVSMGARW